MPRELVWDGIRLKTKRMRPEGKQKISNPFVSLTFPKTSKASSAQLSFPISKRFQSQYDHPKSRTADRFYFVGSYHTNEDRTSLSPLHARNSGILHAQFASMNLLMSMVAIPDFREEKQLSAQVTSRITVVERLVSAMLILALSSAITAIQLREGNFTPSPHGRSSRERRELSRKNMFHSVKWSACGAFREIPSKRRCFAEDLGAKHCRAG